MNREAIERWRQSVGVEEASRITKEASSRGTRIHQLCEDYLKGNEIDCSKYTLADADNFHKLKNVLDKSLNTIWLQEARLYSDFLKMAGTVDCVAEWDGAMSIVDFKTARKPKDREYIGNYFCQATAYAIMFEEMFGIPVNNIVVTIAVDDHEPQVFISKRDWHVDKLLEVREEYKRQYGI